MNTSTTTDKSARRNYNDSLTLYHPTTRGTGAALRLQPAIRASAERANCFFLEMAAQQSPAPEHDSRGRASFDWENKITVKLGFADICEWLAVLENKQTAAGRNGKGLYHTNGNHNTVIRVERNDTGGYAVSLSRKQEGQDEAARIWTVLSDAEAIGIRNILSTGLYFMFASDCLSSGTP